MRRITLDARLQALAEFVRPNSIVADIGTDHALLPCFLKQRGQKGVIASDIGENPLKSAAETLERYGVSGIELVLSNGLSQINFADDIIIAGMGGETIVEIVKNCKFTNNDTRFILQPMTKHHILRQNLYSMGFEIIKEQAVKSNKKIYTIILSAYTGTIKQVDDFFAFYGKQENLEYINSELNKIKKMMNTDIHRYSKLVKETEEFLYDRKGYL